MKRQPNSRTNLDKAIQRFAGEIRRANELRALMANAIVAQMIGDGVVKGGSGLRFRYGDKRTRATMDLDTAWRSDLDAFLNTLRGRLADGRTYTLPSGVDSTYFRRSTMQVPGRTS